MNVHLIGLFRFFIYFYFDYYLIRFVKKYYLIKILQLNVKVIFKPTNLKTSMSNPKNATVNVNT